VPFINHRLGGTLVTFIDLVNSIGEDTGLPSTKVARVLHSFVRIVTAEVMSGAKVRLWKFGVFYGVDTKERQLFGGTRKTKKRKLLRFKRSRYGQ
jgi:nucleoid DNA-binding protein